MGRIERYTIVLVVSSLAYICAVVAFIASIILAGNEMSTYAIIIAIMINNTANIGLFFNQNNIES